ncbi:3-oxoacyl-(acyl-carrier-protein) synthase III [Desulfosporosinus orientis DSM 765]|uniref:3-oxoacyl-(Acyl-carrier-protein) synthase III n=1 Tax=Desulfosporosinus orientis (strain ATCC 19365 / DSM 765 / NCIMB 8382 / VKM B-1628 / Singapore I) TaxID=768706 RepID=G7WD04_DESOD|nr:glycine/sarcosine/betaine reductase complex component C subunit beta [Desulfosporosinus orientis]AET67199.1 3-oxoacyl-(acyl-carrier-protein) synthase III [Desulfosporosinus orientis DSM 765]
MKNPALKGTSTALIHTPGILLQQANLEGAPFRHLLAEQLRSFESVVRYPPNQAFIGNLLPEDLANIPRPWYKNSLPNAKREGHYGEIFPEDEFFGLLYTVDVNGLVCLEAGFRDAVLENLRSHPALGRLKGVTKAQENNFSFAEIQEMIENQEALPLTTGGRIIGCVRKGNELDLHLSAARVMENLTAKASAVAALQLLLWQTGLQPEEVDYIIETSEEACGDIRQKGGGSFAKSIAEACSCSNASGADTRAFCAAPVHGLMQAAALVQSGIFKNVMVVAGGCCAKLGLNAGIHLKHQMPVLEDMLGAFAVHISQDDGINPIVRTDLIGRMKVGCGDSPQMVYRSLVEEPLTKGGYKICDIDRYAGELVNPEIIEPTGCGDITRMNYKMIASLGVLKGEIHRGEMEVQVNRFGVPGFAPNQGHIPSGVPYMGPARDLILQDKINRVMIIGKGSLFLGKLTRLYDAISLILERNPKLDKETT